MIAIMFIQHLANMPSLLYFCAVLVAVRGQFSCSDPVGSIIDENIAIAWLNDTYNPQAEIVYFDAVDASWDYNTNITDYNEQRMVRNFTIDYCI